MARRLAVPGPWPWADLEAADETRVIQEWRSHAAPWPALEDVEAAAGRILDEAVHTPVSAAPSGHDIGRATDMMRPTAAERWFGHA